MFSAILPGNFPIVASGVAPRHRARASVRERRGAHRVLRPWPQRDDPFPQPAAARGYPDADPAVAIERATVLMGPALILTSVVLACGLAVTVFSNLPSLRLFGWLSAFAMMAALAADLMILRPTTMFLRRTARRNRFSASR